MTAALIPEVRLLNALVTRLETIRQEQGYLSDAGDQVRVGDDVFITADEITTPALLLQLESLEALGRSGQRAKYHLKFNLCVVCCINIQSLVQLLEICHDLRKALAAERPVSDDVRRQILGEITFDTGTANSRLAFADMTLQLETVLPV